MIKTLESAGRKSLWRSRGSEGNVVAFAWMLEDRAQGGRPSVKREPFTQTKIKDDPGVTPRNNEVEI